MRREAIARTALCLGLLSASCGKSAQPEESVESVAAVVVRVVKAGPARIEVRVRAAGTTVAAPGAEFAVTAPQQARVVEVPHGEGDRVARGGLLVQFEIPSLTADVAARKSALAQANARVANAQAARDRLSGLMERGVAARREVEDAERDLAEARATVAEDNAGLEAAQQLLARQRVVAPFDGVVVRRWHNPGDLVDTSSADPVLRFADPARVEAEALVNASDVARVAARQPAEVKGPGDLEWPATVVATPAAVDATTSSARVRLALRPSSLALRPSSLDPRPSPPQALPPIGLPIEVAITVMSRDAAVTVPAGALVRDGDGYALFVVSGKKAARREVKVGAVSSETAEILSGVAAGETVVTSGQDGLPDGAAVSVAQ
jgi:RND family efflux transporter MFP subunit